MALHQIDVDKILLSMKTVRVLVVGDVMIDEYLWGEISRISPEAPVPVMNLHHSNRSLGGAANVARNAASLEASVSLVGVIGADRPGIEFLEECDRARINRDGVLTDEGRPTTRKSRLMSREHNRQVFRFDQETLEELSHATQERLLAILYEQIPFANIVICSDYLKGVLTETVLREIAILTRKNGVPLVTAPKDIKPQKYWGASVLMPNLKEFARLAGHHLNGSGTAWMDQAAQSLLQRDKFAGLLVTRGSDGMSLFEREQGTVQRHDIASLAHGVYDVTGAGDTALSVFALALAAGARHGHAAHIANVAAGIVVGKQGTACVTSDDIRRTFHMVGDGSTSSAASFGLSSGASSESKPS